MTEQLYKATPWDSGTPGPSLALPWTICMTLGEPHHPPPTSDFGFPVWETIFLCEITG